MKLGKQVWWRQLLRHDLDHLDGAVVRDAGCGGQDEEKMKKAGGRAQ